MNTYKDCTTEALLVIESALDYHDPELNEEICDRAGLLEAYKSSDEDTFESILYQAIETLKRGDI